VCTVTSPNGGSQFTSSSTLTVSLKEGENVTCTFINTRQTAHLIVIKHVVNDNGGTAVAGDFTMSVTGTGPNPASFAGAESPGTNVTIGPGSYNVSESGLSGYTASYSADCSGTIAAGQTKTCTVTNDDQPGTLTIIKVVVNNSGGTAQVSDFPLFYDSTAATSGVPNTVNAGSYVVSETNQPGYSATISGDCDSSGNVTVGVGESKSCTITNDDQAATITVVKVVNNTHGGTALPSRSIPAPTPPARPCCLATSSMALAAIATATVMSRWRWARARPAPSPTAIRRPPSPLSKP
jgi:hypothetical protein